MNLLPWRGYISLGLRQKSGCIGDEAVRGFELGDALLGWAEEVGGASTGGGVLERVHWLTLRRVGAYAHSVLLHPTADETDACLHRFGARLAGELVVGGGDAGRRADDLCDYGARGLDGVWLGLGADVDRPDERRVNT